VLNDLVLDYLVPTTALPPCLTTCPQAFVLETEIEDLNINAITVVPRHYGALSYEFDPPLPPMYESTCPDLFLDAVVANGRDSGFGSAHEEEEFNAMANKASPSACNIYCNSNPQWHSGGQLCAEIRTPIVGSESYRNDILFGGDIGSLAGNAVALQDSPPSWCLRSD